MAGEPADAAQHVEAADAGHRQVQDDEVRPVDVDRRECLGAVARLVDGEPVGLQLPRRERAHGLVVVHDEHPWCARVHLDPLPSVEDRAHAVTRSTRLHAVRARAL